MRSNPAFAQSDYESPAPSTLCLGCGHDQISRHIMKAFYLAQADPFKIAKISGIGCSSKTPNYFLKRARGFNTIHGRASAVASAVKIANRDLTALVVSGDGDTGSIGLGGFLSAARKNIPMIYIVENNGVYGLTKGQFSATAEQKSFLKYRGDKPFEAIDLCLLALSAGCGFVARSFSGDAKQLTQILKLALAYEGFAFIDALSPCVAYGNEKDFPHSFSALKEGKAPLHELDIINETAPLEKEIKEGEIQEIPLPDGNVLVLKKLGDKDHDPSRKDKAWRVLEDSSKSGNIATGLIYYEEKESFLQKMELSQKPLAHFKDKEMRPPAQTLKNILSAYS